MPQTTDQTITRSTPFDQLPAYLTVPEFCAYVGVGRTVAYDFFRAHGVRIGRLLRLPRERVAISSSEAA